MPVALGTIASQRTATSGFDPLSIAWDSAWWASDPDWTPPSDGAAVSSWRNAGTDGSAATQATGGLQPIYRAAYSNLNSEPAVEFDGSDDYLRSTSATLAQPNHVFIIGWLNPARAGTQGTLIDGFTSNRHQTRDGGSGSVFVYAGGFATFESGSGRHNAFALAVYVNEAGSSMRNNGTPYTITGSLGSQSLSDIMIGDASGGGGALLGALAFVGVKDTALTGGEITDLETWAETFYGVSIA